MLSLSGKGLRTLADEKTQYTINHIVAFFVSQYIKYIPKLM